MNTYPIKKLREETGAGVMDCKRALEEAEGDFGRAKKILTQLGRVIAEKKRGRETGQGVITSYIHHTNRVGAMVELNSETDFMARTSHFSFLAKEIAMQVASMNPENEEELLKQAYIRDPSLTIDNLLKSAIGKLGENIRIKRFIRYEIGE